MDSMKVGMPFYPIRPPKQTPILELKSIFAESDPVPFLPGPWVCLLPFAEYAATLL